MFVLHSVILCDDGQLRVQAALICFAAFADTTTPQLWAPVQPAGIE